MKTPGSAGGTLLRADDIHVTYRNGKRDVAAVTGVSFELGLGESIVLVGESGCGKTTLALALMGLLPKGGKIAQGRIDFQKKDQTWVDLAGIHGETERLLRWTEFSVVYQGAMNALNPLLTVETHFRETAAAHPGGLQGTELQEWIKELLAMVMLEPERVLKSYPHQLSGGMRQRVLIALSLLLKPRLIVLDEPTTALDILTQRAIVTILKQLRERIGFTMIFITHDLALAAALADKVAVMYAGRVVELGTVAEIFHTPRHPYTQALLRTLPRWDTEPGQLSTIPGSPPAIGQIRQGCPFRVRCDLAVDACATSDLEDENLTLTHRVACLRADDTKGGQL